MPRFFKRMFKFPQMDFEMATFEMTSLIIAPKKVFRSIYYHVRNLSRNFNQEEWKLTSAVLETNEKHMASTGSFVYVSSFILPHAHIDSLGSGLCRWIL
jgi:hypothetical protein